MSLRTPIALAVLAVAVGTALPAAAESIASSAASNASSAGSTISGSVSDSIQGSSNSSSGKGDRVAEGLYRVIEVAELPGRPDLVALHLAPAEPLTTPAGQPAADVWLHLPRAAMGQAPLQAGDEVQTRLRAYGIAFARAQQADEPFFLAMRDGWQGEMASRVVQM